MATHRFILSAGHRNTDGGGAAREIEWTYPICVKLKNAIQRRGGKAWIIQEEDGDTDPSFCVGRGLQNAARLCVDLAKAVGGADAYISMHYEGVNNTSVRGFFGIFPDSPYPNDVDVRANNTLDYNLCKVLAKHVEKTGMPKRTGWVVEPGIMSERQTGVGGKGYRLGEFYGTVGFRETTARVILEGGAYTNATDRAMLWDNAWQSQYVEALVDGLEEVYGKFTGEVIPPKPDPTPDARTFTTRFELYLRTNPGFWDYEKNKGNIIRTIPAGTTGTIISGPKRAEGIDWYDISIPGIGTGWVQDEVLHTLSISDAA